MQEPRILQLTHDVGLTEIIYLFNNIYFFTILANIKKVAPRGKSKHVGRWQTFPHVAREEASK